VAAERRWGASVCAGYRLAGWLLLPAASCVLHQFQTLATLGSPQISARLPAYLPAHRWRKSAAELALMRQSAKLAAAAMTECMQMSQPGVHEHQLAAAFEHRCVGPGGWAVGSGEFGALLCMLAAGCCHSVRSMLRLLATQLLSSSPLAWTLFAASPQLPALLVVAVIQQPRPLRRLT